MNPANAATNASAPLIGRRRVPRRSFEAGIGILLHGRYTLERSYQVGEGGMMLSCKVAELQEGEHMVVSFYLPSGVLVVVRGVVRSLVTPKHNEMKRYGIEFMNLEFHLKREIRNFVAAATRVDGHIQL